MTDRAALAELPDDVRALIEPHVELPVDKLQAISAIIAERREEAKKARAASGIEDLWTEAEEAYIGIDDANRAEFADKKWAKPMSQDGPLTTNKVGMNTERKSTAFMRMTARYVDAGAAKLIEILLPADDKAFSITETPLPELIKAKEDLSQVVSDDGTPLTRPARPEEIPQQPPGVPIGPSGGGSPPAPAPASAAAAAPAGAVQAGADGAPRVPLTVKDLAEENIQLARKKAKLAETRVYDWMVECRYTAELRKVIFDSARLGVGVVKGPFPKSSRGIAVNKAKDGGVDIKIKDKVQPAAKWLNPWNFFPDPGCGENIHDGDYCLERDYLAFRQLKKLKKLQGYIGKNIDKVLEEGPQNDSKNDSNSSPSKIDIDKARKSRFEVWYYYGMIKRDELDCIYQFAGTSLARENIPADQQQIYVIVTMINTTIIRATINPLDSGEFPYHAMPWQRRPDSWAGIGIGEQLRMPQKTLNAGVRAMLNNAGKSAGSQIVLDFGAIVPSDGRWEITPDKIWYKKADSVGASVSDAFAMHEIPNVTDEMLKIIEFALKQAEEATSIPLVTQGQSGATTPDTFGATQLQNNNANQLLRTIGYAFDDNITEPLVYQFYEWLLLDPDVPEEEKGDFQINAHGSAALVERAIQDQAIGLMAPLALNPAYRIDPAKWAKVFIRSKRLNPEDLQYTKEQIEAMDKAPPVKDPTVQAAEVKAAVEREKIVAGQTEEERAIAHERELHDSAQALAGNELETDKQIRMRELEVELQIKTLDYANKRNITLDKAKADLAKVSMTLQAQRQLAGVDHAVDLHKHHNAGAQGGDKPGKQQPKHKPQEQRSVAKPLAQLPGRAPKDRAMKPE